MLVCLFLCYVYVVLVVILCWLVMFYVHRLCRGTGSTVFFVQAEDGIRDLVRSRGLGDVYKRQMWLQRPPTRMYWRRGWQAFLKPGALLRNGATLLRLSLIHI